MKIANLIIATALILVNFYFLYTSYELNMPDNGGYIGVGLLFFMSFTVNLFLVPAGITLIPRFHKNIFFLMLNSFGLIWAFVVFYLFNF